MTFAYEVRRFLVNPTVAFCRCSPVAPGSESSSSPRGAIAPGRTWWQRRSLKARAAGAPSPRGCCGSTPTGRRSKSPCSRRSRPASCSAPWPCSRTQKRCGQGLGSRGLDRRLEDPSGALEVDLVAIGARSDDVEGEGAPARRRPYRVTDVLLGRGCHPWRSSALVQPPGPDRRDGGRVPRLVRLRSESPRCGDSMLAPRIARTRSQLGP